MNSGPQLNGVHSLAQQEYLTVREIPISPIRTYARDAVDAVRYDQRQGVLAWRIAVYVASMVRPHHGLMNISLEALSPADQLFYLGLGQTISALTASIDRDAPPTPGEIARAEHRKVLALARGRVRCHATSNQHVLGVWRRDLERPGTEIARCERCGAGASVHVELAKESISDGLLAACPRTGL